MALSRNAVDKLGERLRAGSTTEADWTLLEELRAERQRQLEDVVQEIRSLGLPVSGRVKTTQTLIEKLRRERMRFSQMDDLAGARIRVDGTWLDQDRIVDILLTIWPEARVKDRRDEPVHGYRAVHVIPSIDRWPLEIQVRTRRQDAMANILESLADEWGRQIRYGGAPDDGDTLVFALAEEGTRAEFIDFALRVSDLVALVELARAGADAAGIDDPNLAGHEAACDDLIRLLGELFAGRSRQ